LEHNVELTFFNPATSAQFSGLSVRVGYYEDKTSIASVELLATLPGVELRTSTRSRIPEERRHFLDGIEIFILSAPSLEDFREAAAMGRCIIALATETTRIVDSFINHGENGFVISGGIENIATAISLLRNNPELRGRYGLEIRRKLFERELGCAA